MSDPRKPETNSNDDAPPRSAFARPEYLIFGGLFVVSLVAMGVVWLY